MNIFVSLIFDALQYIIIKDDIKMLIMPPLYSSMTFNYELRTEVTFKIYFDCQLYREINRNSHISNLFFLNITRPCTFGKNKFINK